MMNEEGPDYSFKAFLKDVHESMPWALYTVISAIGVIAGLVVYVIVLIGEVSETKELIREHCEFTGEVIIQAGQVGMIYHNCDAEVFHE